LQKIQTKLPLVPTNTVLFVTLVDPDHLDMLTIQKDPVTIPPPREQATSTTDWSHL
jgi:hypothetical protein